MLDNHITLFSHHSWESKPRRCTVFCSVFSIFLFCSIACTLQYWSALCHKALGVRKELMWTERASSQVEFVRFKQMEVLKCNCVWLFAWGCGTLLYWAYGKYTTALLLGESVPLWIGLLLIYFLSSRGHCSSRNHCTPQMRLVFTWTVNFKCLTRVY